MMLLLLVPLLTQTPLERRILEAEHARAENVAALAEGIASRDVRLQRLAVRAVGRLERPALSGMVLPMLQAGDAAVRREAVNALGQLKVPFAAGSLLRGETDPLVRSVIYATVGRLAPVSGETERLLLAGLAEPASSVRAGAARGLDALYRINRSVRPDSAALVTLRRAARENSTPEIRKYLLTALGTVRDRDSATIAEALHDVDPQVRRLALLAAPRWIDDPSPLVRYEALRLAGSCERAALAVNDPSGHVALLAVDQLATRRCEAALILPLLDRPDWRIRAHAVVALARIAPDEARARLPRLAADSIWQLRVYAANAATILRDTVTLARLAADRDPNVALAAMTTGAEAVRVLGSGHNGLLLKAAQVLKGAPELPAAVPGIVTTLLRLHATGQATLRDAKMELLLRVGEAGSAASTVPLRLLLSDVDPEVARRTAEILSRLTATTVAPVTTSYAFAPPPPDSILRRLRGATATITMRGLGSFTIELLTDDAPATVATFAETAERGVFNGLTIHRIVPNFLIQGGSPGADEYDGATSYFMPEELGLLWHDRGTMGTSTRGHDTGDGQFYINTVDNYRLDHTYSLFARVTAGMDVVDRILEGDVITSVVIRRTAP